MGGQYNGSNVWFIKNNSHNNEYGIGFSSGSGNLPMGPLFIVGNLIENYLGPANTTDGWAAPRPIRSAAGTDVYVYGNTIKNCTNGIGFPSSKTLWLGNNTYVSAPATVVNNGGTVKTMTQVEIDFMKNTYKNTFGRDLPI